MRIHTYQYEAAIALVVLGLSWWAFGHSLNELVGSVAVFLTFKHAQVTDRLSAAEEDRPVPAVECFRLERRYFLGKEMVWATYFLVVESWSPLVGVTLLSGYRVWRRWRHRHRSGRVA